MAAKRTSQPQPVEAPAPAPLTVTAADLRGVLNLHGAQLVLHPPTLSTLVHTLRPHAGDVVLATQDDVAAYVAEFVSYDAAAAQLTAELRAEWAPVSAA